MVLGSSWVGAELTQTRSRENVSSKGCGIPTSGRVRPPVAAGRDKPSKCSFAKNQQIIMNNKR